MGIHKHHIIPKHAGGTNDPENLIELTIEEHAEAHLKLFEEHGRWQDELAWKALSGLIGKEEIRNLASKMGWSGKHTEESKQKIREARKKQKSSGWEWSAESKAKKSAEQVGRKLSDETKKRIGDANRGKPKPTTTCPHCGKVGGIGQLKRWHFDNCKERI